MTALAKSFTGARPVPVPLPWVRGAVGIGALFVVLELITRAELVTPTYLPRATSIVGRTFELFGDGVFWTAAWSTLKACILGLVRATAIGVVLGVVLGLSKWAYRATITVVELLRPLPSVALIALLLPVYGRGLELKVVLITYACVWPILFNTIYGMRSVDPVAVETARSFGLGPIKTAWRVQLRAAAPFIFTGIKIAVAVALILAVSTEIIAGGRQGDGIGIELITAREQSDLKSAYAYTIATGVIGLAAHLLFEGIDRRFFGWNQTEASA